MFIPHRIGFLVSWMMALSVPASVVPQSADGSDGFGVFASSGGNGGSSGTFTGASDIGNPSWGFFASDGELAEALFDLAGGALTVGQSVSLDIDNGNIQSGGTVGVGFQNASTGNRLEFFFVGGDSNYTYLDNGGSQDSGIGFTSSGINLSFTLTGTNTYTLDITPAGSGSTQISGTLGGTTGNGVDRIRFFNFNGGAGSGSDFFGNNISVVPEPGVTALFLGGLGIALLIRRRFRR